MKTGIAATLAVALAGCVAAEAPPAETLPPANDRPDTLHWVDAFAPVLPPPELERRGPSEEWYDECGGQCTAPTRRCDPAVLEDIYGRPGVVRRHLGEAFVLRPAIPFAEPSEEVEGYRTPEVYVDGLLRVTLAPWPLSRNGGGTKVERGIGYVDRDGGLAIPPVFASAETFSEGLAAASFHPEGPFGFIDPRGRMVIEPRFVAVGFFSGGLAPASDGDAWGYIDRSGAWVIEPRFEYAGAFAGSTAPVYPDEWRSARVDRSGRVSGETPAMGPPYVDSPHTAPAFWWPPALREAMRRGASEGRRVRGDQCTFVVQDEHGAPVFDEVPFAASLIALTPGRGGAVRLRTVAMEPEIVRPRPRASPPRLSAPRGK